MNWRCSMFLAVSIKVASAIFLARGSRNTSNSSLHINEIRSKVNGWVITISMEKESLCTHITRNGCVLILDRRCQVRPRKTTNIKESHSSYLQSQELLQWPAVMREL